VKHEIKTFEFKLDDAGEESNVGKISGLAAAFGNIDLGDDVIDKGAFKKTIKDNKGKFPILADHNPYSPIGYNAKAEETDAGLYVEGEINLDVQLGKERYALAKHALRLKTMMGLSIGYYTIKAEPDKERPSVRRLKELKLVEYSFVTFPMNPKAMVTAAKSYVSSLGTGATPEDFAREFVREMKSHGFNPEQIKSSLLTSLGADTATDFDPNLLIQSMDRTLKALKGV
jgi:Escherichia/Staphylococcus phage prohead protease